MERGVNVILDPKFELILHIVLKLLKALYGLTKWGDYLIFQVYIFRKEETTIPTKTPGNLSFYQLTTYEKLNGILALYVDDTLAVGNAEFIKRTNKFPEKCKWKPRESPPHLFAIVMINQNPLGYFPEQTNYSEQI